MTQKQPTKGIALEMPLVSDGQKAQIIALLQEGHLSRDIIADRIGVSPGTVSAIKAHITMGTYAIASTSSAETNELIEAAEATFGLERDLQLALRANIKQLEPGLRIIDDDKEYTTQAGRIDILARDKHGRLVVIELKAGMATPEALTQLLAYMGDLQTKLNEQSVRGILVAGDFHPRILFAAPAVPNVQLRKYRFRFAFETIG